MYILACSQVTVPTSLRALPSGGCSLKHKLSESLLGSLKYLCRENFWEHVLKQNKSSIISSVPSSKWHYHAVPSGYRERLAGKAMLVALELNPDC